MKAVLLVPETKRIGLTGKPILNQEGIVGSLKGSFQAGQRVTLINLKGITQKIAEAQAAMSGAETNIHRSGETIDDIQNGSNEMGSVIDYWERWDRKGVHDRAANIQFLATSVAMDKVRTAMLGESVDPVNLTNDTFPQVYIPRGMYWDPIFSWQKHSLEFNKNSNFVSAYSTRAWMVSSIKSLSGVLSDSLTKIATTLGKIVFLLSDKIIQKTLLSQILATASRPWVGFATQTASLVAISSIKAYCNLLLFRNPAEQALILALLGIATVIKAILGVLISQIKSYGHVELMGNNPSQYLNAPIRRNVDREQWFTYAFIDTLVDKATSGITMLLDKSVDYIVGEDLKMNGRYLASYAFITIASVTPDIPSEHGSNPNPAGIAAAEQAARLILTVATTGDPQFFVYLSATIVPAIASAVVNMAKAFTFITTRTNLNSNIPLNSNSISTSAGKPGKKYNSLNEIGNMDEIPIDNWTSSIAKMSGSLGAISMAGSSFSGAVAGAAGFAREATASAVIAGGPTRYDTYIMSDMNEPYVDWSGNYYRRDNTGRNLVCWSHVFNENLFGIKSSQIGGRKIEKTIVIKTKVLGNTGSTIYCFQALCKCVGESNLHLLFERDALITKRMDKDRYPVTIMDEFNKKTGTHKVLYHRGFVDYPVGYSHEADGIIETILWKGYSQQDGASYKKQEQIIWNFDPENTGDFFTGDRNGKYSEMFEIDSSSGTTTYYNLDGSFYDSKTNAGYTQRSYRPNMEWKYNKLMGEVINTEVTGYDKFMNIPSNYRDRSTSSGDITSYENVHR